MDVSMRSGHDFLVQIVERPGLWMPVDELSSLTQDLRMVAAKTLIERDLSYGVFSGKKSELENTIITVVRRSDGTPVAFNALAIMNVETAPHPTEILHLGLVMVDPAERSKNLSWVLYGLTCFLIFVRRQFRPVWVSNVTQVPAVVGMVSEMFSEVWPKPLGSRRTLDHLMLGRRIMAEHRHVFGVGGDAGFDEDRFVITDAYTGGSDSLKKTWDAAAKHRDDKYNEFCASQLQYDRGDDVLQLGQMDFAAMRRFISREVPRSAVLGLVSIGALVALQRIVLPVMHWADGTKQWSILRPSGRSSDV